MPIMPVTETGLVRFVPRSEKEVRRRRKRVLQEYLINRKGPRGAAHDRARTAKKIYKLHPKTDKDIENQAEWLMDPGHADIAGVDTRAAIKDSPEFELKRTDFVDRFKQRSPESRMADRKRTAKNTTALRARTPRALKIRRQWMDSDGRTADIRGIDSKPKKSGGRLRF